MERIEPTERHFVTIGRRQVHYRRIGSGPAVVLLHESPLSSRAHIPLAVELAQSFTVIALDTPGFGNSDPLPAANPEIADFTDALVDTLDALGIGAAAFWGAHTGACIALDLGCRYPERITLAVLDGLPRFTDEEREDLLANYTPPIEPRWDGTHLLAAFNQRRDMKLFFPWYRKTEAARQRIVMPADEDLHGDALDLIRAKDHYWKGYKAAFRFRVDEPIAGVAVPTTVIARGDEILGPPSFPGASAAVRAEVVPNDRAEWAQAIHRIMREGRQGDVPPAPPATALVPGALTRLYLRGPLGSLFARAAADVPGRTLLLVHQSPFSGVQLVPLAREFARTRPVLLPDSPGYGDSDPLCQAEPAIGDFADAILGTLDHLDEFDVFGILTGSAIAAEIALRAGGRVRNLVLDTVPLFGSDERGALYARMIPEMPGPTGDGALMVWAWAFARDHAMWFPHYSKSPEFARPGPPPSVDELHLRATELLKTGKAYRWGPLAAFRYAYEERLPQLVTRTLTCSHPHATAYPGLAAVGALVPGAAVREHDGTPAGTAALVSAFLDEGGTQ